MGIIEIYYRNNMSEIETQIKIIETRIDKIMETI